ncbi:MFS transporter [Micromonospora aurantiaca]|uniref:MFS transporter n=1 Tax=Micromonospora aurantiaca (nom. illeg.) TaxID=47850 RepID=UPI0033C19C10
MLLGPMATSLGASITAVTGALTVSVLAGALMAIAVGRWLDRHGGRALMTLGSITATALLIAWSQVQTIGQLYAVMIGVGITGAMVLYEPAFAVIVSWFTPDRRPTALLAVTVVAGFASTIFMPLTGYLVAHLGWRGALLTLAAVHGVVTVPLHALTVRKPPHVTASNPTLRTAHASRRTAARAAMRDPRFWILAAALIAHGAATSTIGVHLVSYLTSRGHPATYAATAAGLLGVLSVTGRLVLTAARRRLPVTTIVAGVFAIQAVAVLAMPSPPEPASEPSSPSPDSGSASASPASPPQHSSSTATAPPPTPPSRDDSPPPSPPPKPPHPCLPPRSYRTAATTSYSPPSAPHASSPPSACAPWGRPGPTAASTATSRTYRVQEPAWLPCQGQIQLKHRQMASVQKADTTTARRLPQVPRGPRDDPWPPGSRGRKRLIPEENCSYRLGGCLHLRLRVPQRITHHQQEIAVNECLGVVARLLPDQRPNLLPKDGKLVTGDLPDLRVPVLTHHVADHLRDDRDSAVDRRRGEQAVHQRQTPSARRRERRLPVPAQRPAVTADHQRPDPPAHRRVLPDRLPQRLDVITPLDCLTLTVPAREVVVGYGAAALLQRPLPAREVHGLTAGDRHEKQHGLPGGDDVRSVQAVTHASSMPAPV